MRQSKVSKKLTKKKSTEPLTPRERSEIYRRILEPTRLKPSRSRYSRGKDVNLELLSDKSRIVLSAPFRRLQGKAQVFSLSLAAAWFEHA